MRAGSARSIESRAVSREHVCGNGCARRGSGRAVLIVADGSVVAANAEWCAMTALTAGASKGSGWLAAFHPDDRPRAAAFVAAAGEVYVAQIGMRLGADDHDTVSMRSEMLTHESERILRVVTVQAVTVRHEPPLMS